MRNKTAAQLSESGWLGAKKEVATCWLDGSREQPTCHTALLLLTTPARHHSAPVCVQSVPVCSQRSKRVLKVIHLYSSAAASVVDSVSII